MFGGLVPDRWSAGIAVHFAHRVGALLVAAAVFATAGRVWSHHPGRGGLARPAALIVGLVVVQITLGAVTVLSRLNVAINSAHVVCGALVLATSLVLTLRSWRASFSDVRLQADTQGLRLQPDTTPGAHRLAVRKVVETPASEGGPATPKIVDTAMSEGGRA
jgi:cytochrome c oxidase assembly protein subunit 15